MRLPKFKPSNDFNWIFMYISSKEQAQAVIKRCEECGALYGIDRGSLFDSTIRIYHRKDGKFLYSKPVPDSFTGYNDFFAFDWRGYYDYKQNGAEYVSIFVDRQKDDFYYMVFKSDGKPFAKEEKPNVISKVIQNFKELERNENLEVEVIYEDEDSIEIKCTKGGKS